MLHSKIVGALTAAIVAVSAIVAAQHALPGFRALMSDVAPPGIDTGVRDVDPPRAPRPYVYDRVSRSSSLPYLRGSIIVKFKAGTAPAAQRAMLARAGSS